MNTELLNNLRALADPTKHRLPEGWAVKTHNNDFTFHFRFDSWGFEDTAEHDANDIMDLLGRLARAIEGEGKWHFRRGEHGFQQPYWTAADRSLFTVDKAFQFTRGNAEQEAEALALCILAATKVAAE